jgi:phosphopantothenoylcysteine decarboxylase
MANILLGVTGSVAAVKLPELDDALSAAGHDVKLVATRASTYFFDPASVRDHLSLDEDEWPGSRYRRDDAILHIELRNWADLLMIAPLDANTLAKLSVGLCDNLLTCIWRAWDITRPVIVAPAMNTLMWRNTLTKQHLRALGMQFGALHVPGHLTEEQMVVQINERSRNFWIAPPISKVLACGDEGVGAMANITDLIADVERALTVRG